VKSFSYPLHIVANLTAFNHAIRLFASPISGKRFYSRPCILLSIKFDPIIVTAYLRQGAFGDMTRRDWKIFLLSWLIGNAWWSLPCFAGVETATGLWQWMWG
jgi:hypothetical protein